MAASAALVSVNLSRKQPECSHHAHDTRCPIGVRRGRGRGCGRERMNHRATAFGLILGLALGLLASATDIDLLDRLAAGVAPLGTLFISAIRMVVIPLVMTTIFVGVARLGNPKAVGKLGGSALGFFWGTTVPAIVIGMGFMKLAMAIWPVTIAAPTNVETPQELPGLLDLVLRLIPANPFAAAADGALLPLIVFTLLMAAATGALDEARRHRLITFAEDISAVFVRLIHWILWTAPAGVFGLAAPVVALRNMSGIRSIPRRRPRPANGTPAASRMGANVTMLAEGTGATDMATTKPTNPTVTRVVNGSGTP